MSNRRLSTYFLLLLAMLPLGLLFKANAQRNVSFTFSLQAKATTSAGVFTKDGTLVRTLWSGENMKGGSHIKTWDGLDNEGKPVMDDYEIKVLSNNLTYKWQGVIGNTLSNTRGSFERIFGMAFSGNNGYVALGYNEQQPQLYKFNIADPQTQKSILSKGPTTYHVAADAANVYWSALDPNDNTRHFVYVTRTIDDREIKLANSVSVPVIHSPTFNSAIDVYSENIGTQNISAQVTGLAVQQKGLYLFVTHAGLNELHVLDKLTGKLVKNINLNKPTGVAVDKDDNLWMITANSKASKYLVNADGTLSSVQIQLTGLVSPLAITVSPDNKTVLVADGGNSQQVKAYNTTNGTAAWVLGKQGGFATSPDVSNDKFYFNDLRASYGSYLAYQTDGSFWVGDGGNQRSQHYNADRQYIDCIMYMPASYSTSVDHNDPTRVYSDYMEFKLEYPEMKWKFVKNWGYNITQDKDDQFVRLKGINTLSNGKTYGMVGKGRGLQEVVELTATGTRYTGVTFGLNSQMYPSGDIYTLYSAIDGESIKWYKNAFKGFDAQSNPTYYNQVSAETSPVITNNDPAFRGNITTLTPGEITSTGNFISFDGNSPPQGGRGYHIGAVKNGKWLWKSAFVTHKEYSGPYPTDGSYDIGNGVNEYSGSKALVQDNIVMWGYHGEFWKNGQVNKWNLLYENGLFIGQLGVVAAGVPIAGMAGNSFSASLVKVDEDFYLYHNDESYRSGVHRWRISGINTIKVQKAKILKDISTDTEGTDLMEGLPFNEVLKNNTQGWTRKPEMDDKSDPYGKYWMSKTSVQTTTKVSGRDVYARFRNNSGIATVNRSLPVTKDLLSWNLTGNINFSGNNGNNGYNGGVYFEILDTAGRIIVRLGENRNYVNESNITRVLWANNQTILGGKEEDIIETLFNWQAINISGNNGSIILKYGSHPAITLKAYDDKAKWQSPKTVRLYFFSLNSNYDRIIGVSELRFTADKKPVTNFTDYFRTVASGNWKNVDNWESSNDGENWIKATKAPDSLASAIEIRNNHSITITDSLAISRVNINDGGTLEVLPEAQIQIIDTDGEDIVIAPLGKLLIRSNNIGTGRVGYSTGSIQGNVTVERFLSSKNNASFRMLAPSVNSTESIRYNWQQNANNTSVSQNQNPTPGYGTHITGSATGANGFDATETGEASLFTFNWATNTPVWLPVSNTNVSKLDAKTNYLLYVRGGRDIDLNKSSSKSTNTTLAATGSLIIGHVEYNNLLADGKNSAIANPYASPIDWVNIHKKNSSQFENYYTMWDPNVGSKGGYVTVDASGTKSVRASDATTDIQTGQAFIVKSKKGVTNPTFVIDEDDKSSVNNPNVFRTSNAVVPKLHSSLYLIDEATGTRKLADGVLSRFDGEYAKGIDGDDAEDIANFDENLSLHRSNAQLSIESMPMPVANDTLYLNLSNLKINTYEWQFDASDFVSINAVHAFLIDNYLQSEIPIELQGSTVIVFATTNDPKSYSASRFSIVFEELKTLPVKIISFNATKQTANVKLEWRTANEVDLSHYIIERSVDGQLYMPLDSVKAISNGAPVNNYNWLDRNSQKGWNYYRIKSVDKNGKFQVTNTVSVLMNDFATAMSVFPNPSLNQKIRLNINNLKNGSFLINLTNLAGQLMYTKTINHTGGNLMEEITFKSVPKGMYNISVNGGDFHQTEKLIIL